jgi:starch synthase
MPASRSNPTVLVVTPEVTYLPEGMGNMSNHLTAKAGGWPMFPRP